MTTYFSHLKENIPNNSLGICGYTGISMLFSYYDTYWNDLVISDEFDSEITKINSTQLYSSSNYAYESPGVKNFQMTESINSLISKIKSSGITNEKSNEFKECRIAIHVSALLLKLLTATHVNYLDLSTT